MSAAKAAATTNGGSLALAGDYSTHGDTTDVRLDTLTVALGETRWALRQPTRVTRSSFGLVMDTLVLTNTTGASVTGFARVPAGSGARQRNKWPRCWARLRQQRRLRERRR